MLNNPKYRQLFQDNKLSSLLMYFGIFLYVFHVLDLTEMFERNIFRVFYVLIAIILVLLSFMATIRMKKYSIKWSLFTIMFGLLNFILAISFMICYFNSRNQLINLQNSDPDTLITTHLLKYLNMNVINVASYSLSSVMKMLIFQIAFSVLAISAGVFGYYETKKVLLLRAEEEAMK